MAKKRIAKTISLPQNPRTEWISIFVIAIALFFLVCLCVNSTLKQTAIGSFIVTLALLPFCFKKLLSRIHLPYIALIVFVLIGGISTLYAASGTLALHEYLKLAVSFCIATLLLGVSSDSGAKAGRQIGSILEISAAIAGAVSIDLLSTRWLSGLAQSFLGLFTPEFSNLPGVEDGIRMLSIFSNPNVFAGCVGIGVLLSLGLAASAESGKEKAVHLVCLYINSLSFVLAFSMGATAMIALAFVALLVLEQKDRRFPLFILMGQTLVYTFIAVLLIATTSMNTWTGFRPLPILCMAAGSAALVLSDKFLGSALSRITFRNTKILPILLAAVAAALAAFIVAACSMTGEITLTAGESLRRSIYPEGGEYTVAFDGDNSVNVVITSQNRQDTMMHTSSTLYYGSLADAAFTVPEDSTVVYFEFIATADTTLRSVTYRGPQEGSIPLDYKLLPGFIANRLQGLWTNQNAIQRAIFIEDSLKLFVKSPIIGLGLGGFQHYIRSVQDFYYETIYAHNHYTQTLAETGLIGLLSFMALLLGSAYSIYKARKKDDFHPLLPALGAALVFMAAHAAIEFTFSFYCFLPFAFGTFALINLCCGETITLPKKKLSLIQTASSVAVCVLLIVSTCLLGGNLQAKKIADETLTFEALDRAIELDMFEWTDHAMSYLKSSVHTDSSLVWDQASVYAEKLSHKQSIYIFSFLAEYYLTIGDTAKGIEMLEKYVRFAPSDPEVWNRSFAMLFQHRSDSDVYYTGIANLVSLWREWDEQHIGSIPLDELSLLLLSEVGITLD